MARATCAWCGFGLVQAEVLTLSAWVCPQSACRQRQLTHAIVVGEKGTRVCKYVPLPSQVPMEPWRFR